MLTGNISAVSQARQENDQCRYPVDISRYQHLREEHKLVRIMNYKETYKSPAELSLLQELNAYRRQGCQIFLNGRPSSPEKVAYTCVRERYPYMRDIISDGSETIQTINFIRVREENNEDTQPKRQAVSAKMDRKYK